MRISHLGAAAALASLALLSACGTAHRTTETSSVPTSTAPTPSPTSTTTTDTSKTVPPPVIPSSKKWVDLQAGECLTDPPPTDPAVVIVNVVDCATSHLAEVYLRAAVPVDAAVTDVANGKCDSGFKQYTGQSVAGSPFSITYLIDSDQDRTSNNPYPSTVICVLQSANGQALSGSAHR